mgnify:CR=1 FL=1
MFICPQYPNLKLLTTLTCEARIKRYEYRMKFNRMSTALDKFPLSMDDLRKCFVCERNKGD